MTWLEIYLICFAVGGLWSVISLLGGLGLGSHHLGHGHFHLQHHGLHHHGLQHGAGGRGGFHFGNVLNPGSAAIFLAWFGAAGFLLERHSPWSAATDLAAAIGLGLVGVVLLAMFFGWLQSRDRALDPADYQMPGVLGRVSCPIRPDGVGEVIYLRDGSRTPLPAKSDDGRPIGRGEEVIVTRYEKGIAFVRTWDEMTQAELARGEQR